MSRVTHSEPGLPMLKVGAINHFNFTVLYSISLFCTYLGLIDMLLTNQNAEIVACILLGS